MNINTLIKTMNIKNWPKIIWVFVISILIGLFMANGDFVNFFMNLMLDGDFDSFFLYSAFNDFLVWFFYTVVPLIMLFFLFGKNTSKIIKSGIIGAFIFPALFIPISYMGIFPQIRNFFLIIFKPIFKGYFGGFIYVIYYAFIGFLLWVFIYWVYKKICPKQIR